MSKRHLAWTEILSCLHFNNSSAKADVNVFAILQGSSIFLAELLIHFHFAKNSKHGWFISDNAADTGSLTLMFCHITYTDTQEGLVNGCHPSLTKAYFIASGITAIDLPTGVHLIGQHEIPLIPESSIMVISETQAQCFCISIDSKSHHFGGRSSIIFEYDCSIPLRLEKPLITVVLAECLLLKNWIIIISMFTGSLMLSLGILLLLLNPLMIQCLYPLVVPMI